MSVPVSRAVMALAMLSLGESRREWALAMEAEFEAASEDGQALSFALGCLVAAWRELPAHEEGRLAIASHVLAFLLIATAALLASSILADFPYSYLGQTGRDASSALPFEGATVLNDANRSAVPSLAGLIALLVALHLRMAWLLLERDWTRVAASAALAAAATVTMVIFTTVVFADCAWAPAQAAALAIALAGISSLARWHVGSSAVSARLSPNDP